MPRLVAGAASFVFVGAFVCGLGLGCRPRGGPGDTLAAYQAALAAGRTGDAYALLSSEYRRSHDRPSFERSLGAADRRRVHLGGARVVERADVVLADGDTLPLVREDGAWRFARDPLDFYPQRTPDEALRSFLRALDLERWEVALRFIPQRYRGAITADLLRQRWTGEQKAELRAQVAAVRAHLGEPLELSGDEARLPIAERKQVKLVREEGLWKVETLE